MDDLGLRLLWETPKYGNQPVMNHRLKPQQLLISKVYYYPRRGKNDRETAKAKCHGLILLNSNKMLIWFYSILPYLVFTVLSWQFGGPGNSTCLDLMKPGKNPLTWETMCWNFWWNIPLPLLIQATSGLS